MCQYCGCRDIKTIGDLTAEHEQIRNLIGAVRVNADADRHGAAVESLRQLADLLATHDAIEEQSIYPAMREREEYADKVDILFREHEETDEMMAANLTRADLDGPAAVHWDEVLHVLWTLSEHVEHEENGMFPAAAIELSVEEWERAELIRAEVESA